MTFRLPPVAHLAKFIADYPTLVQPRNWRTSIIITLAVSGSIGLWGLSQIVWLPALPNCWVIAFSDVPAATKLYCAEHLSHRYTPEAYQQAINLVDSIAKDDPLRREGDRHIQRWSKELLRLAEAAYQEGNLDRAIAIARKIPADLHPPIQTAQQIKQWQSTWTTAEALYQAAEQKINHKKWYDALVIAKKLLFLDNRYWETEKYDQLITKLQAERETADWTARNTGVKTAEGSTGRYSIDQFFQELRQKQDREANVQLSKARNLAQSGKTDDLEAAIDQAQQVMLGTANYDEAQTLIHTWRDRIETLADQPQLERATQLAATDDPTALRQAIDTAAEIGWGRALHDEANDRMDEWRDRLNQLETQARTEQLEHLTHSNNSLLHAIPEPVVQPTSATAIAPPDASATLARPAIDDSIDQLSISAPENANRSIQQPSTHDRSLDHLPSPATRAVPENP